MRTLSVNVVGYVDWILAGVESMFVHRFARVASIFIIDSVIFFFLRSSSDIVNLIHISIYRSCCITNDKDKSHTHLFFDFIHIYISFEFRMVFHRTDL